MLSERETSADAPPNRLSVLVVDPHEDTRQLYRGCFELAGYAVTAASDGRDALIKALDEPPR